MGLLVPQTRMLSYYIKPPSNRFILLPFINLVYVTEYSWAPVQGAGRDLSPALTFASKHDKGHRHSL